jgi:hypothetical protein
MNRVVDTFGHRSEISKKSFPTLKQVGGAGNDSESGLEYVSHHRAMDIGQSKVSATVAIGEPFVIDP